MTEQESYQEHIRYTHDTYCRIVIRHASFDAARMLAARWQREISLEYLTEEKFVQLSTTDEYFQVPDYGETYPFSVRGKTIFLDSYSLAAAAASYPFVDLPVGDTLRCKLFPADKFHKIRYLFDRR